MENPSPRHVSSLIYLQMLPRCRGCRLLKRRRYSGKELTHSYVMQNGYSRRGEYDLAAFSIEQFCQRVLKYKLLIKTGTYPRTRSLLRLLRELVKLAPEKDLTKFIDSEIMFLTRVEDAYIVSRYLPRRYERREVEELLKFADRFREVVEDI